MIPEVSAADAQLRIRLDSRFNSPGRCSAETRRRRLELRRNENPDLKEHQSLRFRSKRITNDDDDDDSPLKDSQISRSVVRCRNGQLIEKPQRTERKTRPQFTD